MEELSKAIRLASEKFVNEVKNGEPLEKGDSFVAVFNNCCLYVDFTERGLVTKFMGDMPVKVDMTLSIYEPDEEKKGYFEEDDDEL